MLQQHKARVGCLQEQPLLKGSTTMKYKVPRPQTQQTYEFAPKGLEKKDIQRNFQINLLKMCRKIRKRKADCEELKNDEKL